MIKDRSRLTVEVYKHEFASLLNCDAFDIQTRRSFNIVLVSGDYRVMQQLLALLLCPTLRSSLPGSDRIKVCMYVCAYVCK